MADRELKIWGDSGTFSIKLPEDAKVTFGPWSPPSERVGGGRMGPERGGTLRVYKGTKTTGDVLAVFAGVQGFRDTSLEYTEEPVPTKLGTATVAPIKEKVAWEDLDEDEKKELAEMVASIITGRMVDEVTEEKDAEPEEEAEVLPF